MKNTIFLPKKIKVGFQNRDSTYTGRLAYIIYYDQKNKLRKEVSWNSWRDNEIEPLDFDNEPTSGFVLNKKVGDYKSDWNHRQAYVRVYDPRNFEFEIDIENLLYILQNTSCIKGKGLEGEFVYGWHGTNLILIPVCSPDYEEISKYSEVIHKDKKIRAKDLIIGATYRTKTNEDWTYMGKFDHWKIEYKRYRSYNSYSCEKILKNKGKYHFFASIRKRWEWATEPTFDTIITKSLTRFVDVVSTECAPNYAELFDKLECCSEYSPVDPEKDKYISYTKSEFIEILSNHNYWFRFYDENKEKNEILLSDGIISSSFWGSRRNKTLDGKTPEEVYDITQPVYKNEYLRNGKLYQSTKKGI